MKVKDRTRQEKPEIQYPCLWQYKAIGRQKELLFETVESVFHGHSCEISYSKSSKTGKYHSYTIEIRVNNEDKRNNFFQLLKDSSNIIMVL